jgi:hypothetical protein
MGKIYVIGTTLIIAGITSGCVSTVTTYDSAGNVIGSCKAHKTIFGGGDAICHGTANQEGSKVTRTN